MAGDAGFYPRLRVGIAVDLRAGGAGLADPGSADAVVHVFKTRAFDLSANLPYKIIKFLSAKSKENDFVEKFVEVYNLRLPL